MNHAQFHPRLFQNEELNRTVNHLNQTGIGFTLKDLETNTDCFYSYDLPGIIQDMYAKILMLEKRLNDSRKTKRKKRGK